MKGVYRRCKETRIEEAVQAYTLVSDLDSVTVDDGCGNEAAVALDRFLAASRPTRCEFVERDRYGRFVGVCFRADDREVNRWLVSSGNAVDWERYSKGAYAEAQRRALAKGAGIWRGKFQVPCEARADRARREPAC